MRDNVMHQLRLRRLPYLAADDTPERDEEAERRRENVTLIGAETEEKNKQLCINSLAVAATTATTSRLMTRRKSDKRDDR